MLGIILGSEEKVGDIELFQDISKHTKLKPNLNMMLFLDVATTYTGYAIFERNRIDPSVAGLVTYGNFRAPTKYPKDCPVAELRGEPVKVRDRCRMLCSKISNIFHTIKPAKLYMEYPTVHGGVKGRAAAESGGVLYLAYMCGKLDACWDYYLANVLAFNKGNPHLDKIVQFFEYAHFVTYNEWAGECSKSMTCDRLKTHFGLEADPASVENNWADAIMMGRAICQKQMMKAVPGPNMEQVDL